MPRVVYAKESSTLRDRLHDGDLLVERSGRRPAIGPKQFSTNGGGGEDLPSIDASRLSGTTIAAGVRTRGAIVVRGLLDESTVASLRPLADPEAVQVNVFELTPRAEHMVNALAAIFHSTGLLHVTEQYLGDEPVVLAHRTVVRREENTRGIAWHQDAPFFGGRRWDSLNFWIALSRCGDRCPSLSIVPDRFEEVIDETNTSLRPTEKILATARDRVQRGQVVQPVLDPGDALLFDELTLHRTGMQKWDVPSREVVRAWFFAASRFPVGHGNPLVL